MNPNLSMYHTNTTFLLDHVPNCNINLAAKGHIQIFCLFVLFGYYMETIFLIMIILCTLVWKPAGLFTNCANFFVSSVCHSADRSDLDRSDGTAVWDRYGIQCRFNVSLQWQFCLEQSVGESNLQHCTS